MAGYTKFITFYTPTFSRPALLKKCQASVLNQSDPDFEHIIIPDLVGIGVPMVHANIQNNLDLINGAYTYILNDDDQLADQHVIRDLKQFARAAEFPAVIIAKMERGQSIYPTPEVWKNQRPTINEIGAGNYVVRTDIFKHHADQFGQRYNGDFDFIDYLYQAGYKFTWYDRIILHAPMIGAGRSERELLGKMKVKVIKSFAGRDAQGNRVSHGQGDIIDLPPGVDWVRAGLVEPIKAGQPAAKKRETGVNKKATKRVKRGTEN